MLCGSTAEKISLEKMLIEHETLEFSRSQKNRAAGGESEYGINRITCEYYLNLLNV